MHAIWKFNRAAKDALLARRTELLSVFPLRPLKTGDLDKKNFFYQTGIYGYDPGVGLVMEALKENETGDILC